MIWMVRVVWAVLGLLTLYLVTIGDYPDAAPAFVAWVGGIMTVYVARDIRSSRV